MKARYDDLDTRTIALASVVSAIVLLILILAGRAMAYGWAASVEESKFSSARYEDSEQYIAQQKAVLQQFKRVEESTEEGQSAFSRLVIPIDRAVELMSLELKPEPGT